MESNFKQEINDKIDLIPKKLTEKELKELSQQIEILRSLLKNLINNEIIED